jgi:hypothetical protein
MISRPGLLVLLAGLIAAPLTTPAQDPHPHNSPDTAHKDDAKSGPSIKETVAWMENFSAQHGTIYVGSEISQVNTISGNGECSVTVDHKQPHATGANTIKHGQEKISLGDFDPKRIKVLISTESGHTVFELTFERTDSSPKIQQDAEMGDGRKTTFNFTQESLFFDTGESAQRFAKALGHGITVCGGVPSLF